jgi:hypothetical protein
MLISIENARKARSCYEREVLPGVVIQVTVLSGKA